MQCQPTGGVGIGGKSILGFVGIGPTCCDVICQSFLQFMPSELVIHVLELCAQFLLGLVELVNLMVQFVQLLVGEQVLLDGLDSGADLGVGTVCFGIVSYDLIDDVGIKIFASNKFLKQGESVFFGGIDKVGKRALGNQHGVEKLFELESNELGQAVPVLIVFGHNTITALGEAE